MLKNVLKKISLLAIVTSMILSVSISGSIVVNAETDTYQQRFIDMWEELHDSDNGYFSSQGIPYHSVETLMCEAPDYGHETTSEAFSYYMWLEAMYGKFTGDWSELETAWDITEQYMIPTNDDQPTNSNYDPSSPATYAEEYELPDYYPSELDFSVPVGTDPLYDELVSAYGDSDIYGMHWLLDVDNWYGYGVRGDGTSTPSYINTFQRGEQESVWETVTHPSWEEFNWGGPNGFLDLFTGDSTYSKQWRYTNAPDADARAVQAMYWANKWAEDQGSDISSLVAKASKMGDYLRYSLFDKYFKVIGSQDVDSAGTGYDAAHYLMSWYYAWGGGIDADWAWRIGCSHSHFGYQNPMAAWILSEDDDFKPLSDNGASDWAKSLTRQLEFYQWLQSDEGAIAGGATNSYNGRYEEYPDGTSTFYGMAYDEHPVYHDPGSNRWFGMQSWSMQRLAELYYETGNEIAEEVLDKWVSWVKSVVDLNDDGTYQIPDTLEWSGQPDTWTGTSTGNSDLHVEVTSKTTDVGSTASLANALLYYSAATDKWSTYDDDSRILAKELLDRMWTLYRDDKGVSVTESRSDYSRMFEQEVYIPEGWSGTMANGDVIEPGVKFIDIRSKYKDDPDYEMVEEAYNAGEAPEFNYHRFWSQCDVAIANGTYALLFGSVDDINNSSITPTTAEFDLINQSDIEVTMTLNGNTFSGISNGSTALTENTDYVISDNVVTIKKEYLAAQDIGTISLTFDFSAGSDATLEIDIIDSSVVETDLVVEFYNGNTSTISNSINPKFKLTNTGTTAIDLSDITLRYYYTIDGEKSQNFWCDWSPVGSSNVTGSFVEMDTAVDGADYYLEVGFTSSAGGIDAGESIEVQTRFAKSDWSNYTQSNDYSFNASSTYYSSSDTITMYVNGSLAAGIEP